MRHVAKFRPNFLYSVTLTAAMICFLAVTTDIGGQAIAGMAGVLIGVVGGVCEKLVDRDEPQPGDPEPDAAAEAE